MKPANPTAHPLRRPIRPMAASLAVVAGLTLAGCGGDSKADTVAPPTSATTTTTPTPTTSAAGGKLGANPEPTAQAKTAASAKQFAQYFLILVERAYETRDMSPVWAHANRATCSSCRYSAGVVRKQIRLKYRQINDGPIRVRKIVPKSVGAVWDLEVVFDLPPGRKLQDDGKVIDRFGSAPNSRFEAFLTWTSGHWQVKDYSIEESKPK